jgi:hypothetical protein
LPFMKGICHIRCGNAYASHIGPILQVKCPLSGVVEYPFSGLAVGVVWSPFLQPKVVLMVQASWF